MYNLIIKDFGNGKKQAVYYSAPISEQKRKVTIIQEEIKKFMELKNKSPDINLQELAKKRLSDLYHELDMLKAEKTLPCELTDSQYEKWLQRREDEKISNKLKSDKRDKKKIFDYSRSNKWEWFATFTFSQDVCDRTDYGICRKKLSNWLKNFNQRYCNKELKYLALPEQHKKIEENGLHAWHFHALLANVNTDFLQKAIGEFDKSGRQIYRFYTNCNLGRTELTKVDNTDAVSKYITKYITKSLGVELQGKHRHIASTNLLLPEVKKFIVEENNLDTYINTSTVVWEQQKAYEVCGSKRKMHIFELEEKEK